MLLTIFVLCYVRPLLRSRQRRHRAICLTLVAVCLVSGGLSGIANANERGQSSSSLRSELADEAGTATDTHFRTREGTLIPPTSGRIINVGRRWAFLPDSPQTGAPAHVRTMQDHPNRVNNEKKDLGADDQSSQSLVTSREVSGLTSNRLRASRQWSNNIGAEVPSRETLQSADATARDNSLRNAPQPPAATKDHLVLCENLVLQRMVQATRIDPKDDGWIVTGQVLEFFDQNRLLLHTAQRADTN